MARPRKQTVDYFPHMCTHGKTMFVLEQRYGNDGYAFWFKLLEMLGVAEGHYLQLDNLAEMEFLAAKTRIDMDKCREILDLLAVMGAIDAELWAEQVVWSDNFVEGVSDAYRKRTVEIPQKPSFLRRKSDTTEVSGAISRRKSTNEMKLDETKGDINTSSPDGAGDAPQTPAITSKRAKLKPTADPAVVEVYQHYCRTWADVWTRTPALTEKRATAIHNRLNKYSTADLMTAIDAVHASDWHRGINPNKTVYGTLDFIMRNDDQVQTWLEKAYAQEPRASPAKQETPIDRMLREAMERGAIA